MKALDTSVLVRYYAQDDTRQSPVATRIMTKEPALFVPKTVLIEFWWVLTKADKFRFPVAKVIAVFKHLLGLPNIWIEDEVAVGKALVWCEAGLEFQDALHLASAENCDTMLTFDDRRFARRVNRLGLYPPCQVLASADLS